MKEYTSTQLDKKIHNFLARKLQEFPELEREERESKQSKRSIRERHDIMHTFMPSKLKLQF